jgi:hypothetical protein
MPDNANDIAEVFILQCLLTVFENSRQKADDTNKAMPNITKTKGKPPNIAYNAKR